MDDTFLPFGRVITEHERDTVKAYLKAGGHIAFNTLASKEWFYLRVIEPVALANAERRSQVRFGQTFLAAPDIDAKTLDNDPRSSLAYTPVSVYSKDSAALWMAPAHRASRQFWRCEKMSKATS